jgi:hypothetical protein
MRTQTLTLSGLLVGTVAISLANVAAQAPAARVTNAPASTYSAPRTPWGDPDLQGTFTYT